jgi:hypothetical protein
MEEKWDDLFCAKELEIILSVLTTIIDRDVSRVVVGYIDEPFIGLRSSISLGKTFFLPRIYIDPLSSVVSNVSTATLSLPFSILSISSLVKYLRDRQGVAGVVPAFPRSWKLLDTVMSKEQIARLRQVWSSDIDDLFDLFELYQLAKHLSISCLTRQGRYACARRGLNLD